MNKPIYLDYNGTTPHAAEVIAAMLPYLESEFGNPSSSHWYGVGPKKAVEDARNQVAALLGCQADEIVFTSGGTESNNHALKSIGGSRYGQGDHIVTSNIEHPAVLNVCRFLHKHGFRITYVEADEQGTIAACDVAAAIQSETIMVSIMHANNEVGTLQPVAEIAAEIGDKPILLHTDAAQSVGKVPVAVNKLGVDLLSIAGHKLYGPKGIGALYVKKGVKPEIFCHGAGQERGVRGGTENVLEIVGLGMACELAEAKLTTLTDHMCTMRDRLEDGLRNRVADIRINGHLRKRLPNTSSVSFYGLDAERILLEIGDDVAASAGAACHSGDVAVSHVLTAMQVPREWARGTIRFSTGRMTTAAEIDKTIEVVADAVGRLRK